MKKKPYKLASPVRIEYTIVNDQVSANLAKKLCKSKLANFCITQKNYVVGNPPYVFQVTIIKQLNEPTIPKAIDDSIERKLYDDLFVANKAQRALVFLRGYLQLDERTISISYSLENEQYTDTLIALLSEYIIELFQFIFGRIINQKKLS